MNIQCWAVQGTWVLVDLWLGQDFQLTMYSCCIVSKYVTLSVCNFFTWLSFCVKCKTPACKMCTGDLSSSQTALDKQDSGHDCRIIDMRLVTLMIVIWSSVNNHSVDCRLENGFCMFFTQPVVDIEITASSQILHRQHSHFSCLSPHYPLSK